MAAQRISTRNARFQQWQALLGNRTKRTRSREFLVQGVRPITLAAEHGWAIRTLIHDASRPPSRWAEDLLRAAGAEQVAMEPELLAELGEKTEGAPEVVAVVGMPPDDLDRIAARDAAGTRNGTGVRNGTGNRAGVPEDFLGVVFDRPTSPGNIGSLVRSADAFGADGVVVTGHAADVYDPKAVRASTGSLFAVPVVRAPSHREVAAWLDARRARAARDAGAGARSVVIVGTDEHGEADVADFDLTQPVLLLVGNETAGLSTAWRDLCDHVVSIPMSGSASSLNAANAATVVLYEAARQRAAARRR